jgi:hypothetical protein
VTRAGTGEHLLCLHPWKEILRRVTMHCARLLAVLVVFSGAAEVLAKFRKQTQQGVVEDFKTSITVTKGQPQPLHIEAKRRPGPGRRSGTPLRRW